MKAIVCALVIGLIVPSFAGAAVENIQVSNNNFVAVTISWTTDGDVTGEVHYSESPDLSNPMPAYDVRGQFYQGCTHYVDITGLTRETVYYFKVVAGGETDDNGGSYYTFTTMKQPGSPPTPCTLTGCVYEEDGTTLAVGAMVYLRVTHGGVESYLLSDLLGSPGDATPGCFAFDIREARSTATNDLFPSIDPGDHMRVMAIDCGDYRAESDLVFNACFTNGGFLSLEYTPPGTVTTSVPGTTTTTAPGATTTSVPGTTTTTAPGTTTTSAPETTTSIPEGGCTADAECDDGVYCNGVETCDLEAGCQPGSDPCEENERCSEEDNTCTSAIDIEASIIAGCGAPFFARLGVVEIQGTGTDFKARSVVRYDSSLVIKSLKLLNSNTQTITQFVILLPSFGSILFTPLDYPATVTVTVDGFSDTFEIPECGQ